MRTVRTGFFSLCSLALVVSLAHGIGQIEMGSEEGLENPPVPTEGEDVTTEEEFNPTITCTVGPEDDIYDLIDCLLDEISNPPPPPPCPPSSTAGSAGSGGIVDFNRNPDDNCVGVDDRSDFYVTPLPFPRFGVQIERLDGEKMERLMFRENDPGIQTTQISIENADRVGRIHEIVEDASTFGEVHLHVNKTSVVTVSTFPGQTSVEITALLVKRLRDDHGYLVYYRAPYVYFNTPPGAPSAGITQILMRSTDPAIVSSDLGLLQPDDKLLPFGFALPGQHPEVPALSN